MASKVLRQVSRMLEKPVKGVLLDITGVLYESGTSKPIEGSVEAINRLRHLNVPFRLVTNETQRTRASLAEKLQSFGFTLSEHEIFSPGPAAVRMLQEKQLQPYLLVHPGLLPEFESIDMSSPNCVVIGDAAEDFTYENINKVFQFLITLKEPLLISLGKGKYYKEKDELVLDVGAFTHALEYACGIEAVIVGKPSPDFFLDALREMNVNAEEAIMVGDDISSDVGAAQKCGVQGVLVRTGKFRPSDEQHKEVKPDAIVDNLAHFVDLLENK